MKPRIFITSLYYDLNYVREELPQILRGFNLEPVLFESKKVTFDHTEPLDVSSFNEVNSCNAMVLIMGGRYSSVLNNPDSPLERDLYDGRYTFLVKDEYEKAAGIIPVYIFIKKDVYSELQRYKSNRRFLGDLRSGIFDLLHADSLEVFRLMFFLQNVILFEENHEIEQYLKDHASNISLKEWKPNLKQPDDHLGFIPKPVSKMIKPGIGSTELLPEADGSSAAGAPTGGANIDDGAAIIHSKSSPTDDNGNADQNAYDTLPAEDEPALAVEPIGEGDSVVCAESDPVELEIDLRAPALSDIPVAEETIVSLRPSSSVAEKTDLPKAYPKSINDLPRGYVNYEAKGEMKIGVIDRVKAEVFLKEELLGTIKNKVNVAEIHLSKKMTAKLLGDKEKFEIVPLSTETQGLLDDDKTTWSWDVKPLKSGQGVLELVLSIAVDVENFGIEMKDLETYRKDISIHINPVYTTKHFLANNWVSILSIIFGSGLLLTVLKMLKVIA